MARTGKKTTPKPAKGRKTKQEAQPTASLDRRWSILLFGVGVLIAAFCIIRGESAWAWVRTNMLFGIFGASTWVLGPLFMLWGVLTGLEKRLWPYVAKGIFFVLVLSGTALVFGNTDLVGLSFGGLMQALHQNGAAGGFSGGVVSIVFGWTLMAAAGRVAARVLLVLLVLAAVMLLTGITPGDVAHFVAGVAAKFSRGRREEYEDEGDWEDAADPVSAAPPAPLPSRRANQPSTTRRKRVVDIDIGPEVDSKTTSETQYFDVEIGPGGTFGADALAETHKGAAAGEPLTPFNPYSSRPLGEDAAQQKVLLFGEDDPYANLGGAQSQMPDGTLLDVEYLPQEKEKNLFNWNGQPAVGGEGNGAKQAPADSLRPAAPNGAAPSVDELIARAAAPKEEPQATAETVHPDAVVPYQYPPLSLFQPAPPNSAAGAREEMKHTADLLVSTLASFGVKTRILDVSRGPSVTRYEIQPQAGVKISRITGLADDIALNLAAAGVRIEAPIPGRPAVGIEVPNNKKTLVTIRSILESDTFANTAKTSPLCIALGKDIAGENVVSDLTKMPHLLIAGATGSGKSVCVNSIIMSFLYQSSPEEVRMILIDPKVVELAEYNGIPHLLIPVVTEPRQAAKALGYAVSEMEKRYHLFAENNVRDITSFNKKAARTNGEKIPHIVIIIDELADLMMAAGKDVENFICRIAQKARAAGMHLIVATQRPSVDVITGLIKSNIPSRIAFAVSSQVDSRVILDGAGAEKLLGNGDMLFMPLGANKPLRVQGTYVKDKEISEVLRYVKNNEGAQYDDNVMEEMDKVLLSNGGPSGADGDGGDSSDIFADPTFVSAVETALDQGQISTSFLQRRLRLGYARAGRIMDEMEQMHIISPPEGSKPRQVLITRQQWQEMSMNAADK